jgi:hypothetical protein
VATAFLAEFSSRGSSDFGVSAASMLRNQLGFWEIAEKLRFWVAQPFSAAAKGFPFIRGFRVCVTTQSCSVRWNRSQASAAQRRNGKARHGSAGKQKWNIASPGRDDT